MSRHKHYLVPAIPITDLLLDTLNPRIRHGQDQNDCIARILRNRESFLNLLKDIAVDGLGPDPVLVSKNDEGKWVVRDGNRRITALKLLNTPVLCLPDSALVSQITRIAENRAIPASVDCLACDDEDVIRKYLERKHTGENGGVGQRGWTALLKSLFNLQFKVSDQSRRAAQLVRWVEDHGMQVSDDFNLTNLQRGLKADTLALIGFAIENDELKPILPVQQSYALAARVVNDVATERIHVKRGGEPGSIFTSDEQLAYFKRVRAEVGPAPEAEPSSETYPSPGALTTMPDSTPSPEAVTASETTETNAHPPTDSSQEEPKPERKPSSPTKAPWDRPSLFGPRKNASPGISIPASETKAQTIVVELRKLNPYETPLSTTMLLRALLELSNDYYREKKSLKHEQYLHKSMATTADHMQASGLLTKQQHDLVMRYTRTEEGMLHVKTVQAYLHKDNFHPNAQALNTFWDEIGCFVAACWR